jgi:hypothetical protein
MRKSLPLLTTLLLAAASVAGAQTATTQQAASGPAAAQSAAQPTAARQPAAAATGHGTAHPAGRLTSRHSPAHGAAAAAKGGAPAGGARGMVNLGATDITGNKELPKVMAIVPWKRSSGAGGVVQPTDSLLDEVLEPVDRGVFQRQIRYYGQLNAAGGQPAAGRVAPVGDRQ